MSGQDSDDIDPVAWIKYVGIPTAEDVKGIKRTIIWATGWGVGAGMVLGPIVGAVLKKIGVG